MGVYRRSDSPTWWMSLQVEQRRVRLNTGVEDRRLAEEIFAAWKVEVARERWLGARPPDQHYYSQGSHRQIPGSCHSSKGTGFAETRSVRAGIIPDAMGFPPAM